MVLHPSGLWTSLLSLMSSANLLRLQSILLSMALMKSQYRPMRNTTYQWFSSRHWAVDRYPLDVTIQPIFYPLGSLPIKSKCLQFGDKDTKGSCVKAVTDDQVDDMNILFLVRWCSQSIIEGHQIGEAGLPLMKSRWYLKSSSCLICTIAHLLGRSVPWTSQEQTKGWQFSNLQEPLFFPFKKIRANFTPISRQRIILPFPL